MLHRPMNRICPSLMRMARSKTLRHLAGLMKGSNPSTTSISANAPNSRSVNAGPESTRYFFAGAVAAPGPPLRIDWKNSPLGSTTITSDLLRKAER